tara:strand:- start:1189 stop:2109 length:921 start_codon:yes stop_codon:yes gene_type:complete
MKNKIIDCFTFFNELDLLEIRLKYLFNSIDYFVIVESDQTFSGNKKSFVLKENWERFKPYHNKMLYVPLKMKRFEMKHKVAWKREEFQRNGIRDGIKQLNLKNNDIILVGDIDEIPNKESIKRGYQIFHSKKINIIKFLKSIIRIPFSRHKLLTLKVLFYTLFMGHKWPIVFKMGFFYYFMNYKKLQVNWNGTVFINYKLFKKLSAENIRRLRYKTYKKIHNAGWHFSYLGGKEQIKKKLKGFSHQEFNIPEIVNDQYIDFCIQNGYSLFDFFEKETKSTRFTRYDLNLFPDDFRAIISNYNHLVY